MPIGKKISPQALADVEKLLKTSSRATELKAVQCIWLRGKHGLTSKQIASQIGWSESNVKRVHADYFKRGLDVLKREPSHHRRNQNLSREAEESFLAPFFEKAKAGGIIRVAEIKQAYEEKLGRKVHHSVIYTVLDRHGWRKIAPRPRHPKADKERQDLFKKTA